MSKEIKKPVNKEKLDKAIKEKATVIKNEQIVTK